MARPRKEGLEYFPHDVDASSDPSIEKMEAVFGLAGYAFYFKLLERIYQAPDATLDLSSPGAVKIIARKFGMRSDYFLKMARKAVESGLFDRDVWENRCSLTSRGILKRATNVTRQREYWRDKHAQDSELSPKKTTQGIKGFQRDNPASLNTQSKAKQTINNKAKDIITTTPTPTPPPKELSLLSEEVKEKDVFILWDEEIGKITETVRNTLVDAVETYTEDCVRDAIKEAVRQNVRKWPYIQKILENWATKGRNVTSATGPPGREYKQDYNERTVKTLERIKGAPGIPD